MFTHENIIDVSFFPLIAVVYVYLLVGRANR